MKHLMKYLRAVVWCLPFLLLLPPSASAGEAGTLRFPEDGKLKIAIFADLQTTQNVPRNLLTCVRCWTRRSRIWLSFWGTR